MCNLHVCAPFVGALRRPWPDSSVVKQARLYVKKSAFLTPNLCGMWRTIECDLENKRFCTAATLIWRCLNVQVAEMLLNHIFFLRTTAKLQTSSYLWHFLLSSLVALLFLSQLNETLWLYLFHSSILKWLLLIVPFITQWSKLCWAAGDVNLVWIL